MTNNDTAAWGRNGGLHANLIEDSAMTRGYINNAFIPIIEHYANQCNLLAYDLINEPEWAMNIPFAGNTSQVVAAGDMQRFVDACRSGASAFIKDVYCGFRLSEV